MSKIFNLIWQTNSGDETDFEKEYITNIVFNQIDKELYFNNKNYDKILDNSIIIYSNNSTGIDDSFLNYITRVKQQTGKLYLYHLSNENDHHNASYYNLADLIIRPYYHKHLDQYDNIQYVPLGFKSGFLNTNNSDIPQNKTIDMCFIGQSKSDRNELIDTISKFDFKFLHLTNSWNCSTSLSVMECRDVYKQTKFSPCPMGFVHADSFRIMESLESGSIPILKNYNNLEYFTKVYGHSPILIVNSWEEIINYNKIPNNLYSELYNDILIWYSNFKINLSLNIKQLLLNL
jgi:hypothetical protein